jgi:hypothetical protein
LEASNFANEKADARHSARPGARMGDAERNRPPQERFLQRKSWRRASSPVARK